MKIRRWEDRDISILVEYDLQGIDTLEEALAEMKVIDSSDKFYDTKKELVAYDSSTFKEAVENREPLWIDELNYWKAEDEKGNWKDLHELKD
jgi:hypothetical protein